MAENSLLSIKEISAYASYTEINRIYRYMEGHFPRFYPEFDNWFFTNVVPGLEKGERSFFILSCHEEILGLSIIKKKEENKICSFYIDANIRRLGYGKCLLDISLKRLIKNNPLRAVLITVPEEKITTLYPLLRGKGFSYAGQITGKYRKNKNEHFLYRLPTLHLPGIFQNQVQNLTCITSEYE